MAVNDGEWCELFGLTVWLVNQGMTEAAAIQRGIDAVFHGKIRLAVTHHDDYRAGQEDDFEIIDVSTLPLPQAKIKLREMMLDGVSCSALVEDGTARAFWWVNCCDFETAFPGLVESDDEANKVEPETRRATRKSGVAIIRAELRRLFPGMTRQQVLDAVSETLDRKATNKDIAALIDKSVWNEAGDARTVRHKMISRALPKGDETL